MSKAYICPVINDRDPAAKDFDGEGHTVQLGGAGGRCQEVGHDGEPCAKELVEASQAWRDFLEPAENTKEDS